MRRLSLTADLAIILALLTLTVMTAVGLIMYRTLERQLIVRDDGALITRVDQIRTLLHDEDVLDLIHNKPQLFANMLGNTESLLVLRFPGKTPLIEVNPGHSPVPDIAAVPADGKLSLAAVHHRLEGDIPFIYTAAQAETTRPPYRLEIITGRLMMERTHMLASYRRQIFAVVAGASLLTMLLAGLVARRGLLPLHRLAAQTGRIGSKNLSIRIDSEDAPPELKALIDAFNLMLDRLELSFTQLSQVSADMAHDLRTPIATLMGQTEVALSRPRPAEQYTQLLGSNFEELGRLSKMIENMLFLARAEQAGHAIDRAWLDISDEFATLNDYFDGPAQERDLRLAFSGDGQIYADPQLLRRALANLLANAIQYADAGTTVTISAERRAEDIVLSVGNRGPDIATEHLERLFERFYRAEASRTTATQASGLGLAIVRGIMTLHQGGWRAISAAGQTCFQLTFPHGGRRRLDDK
ncbi:heavy metal sensor histidine kinase [Sodalis sp. dw_96]|uniref:heavy metal sensor histidine kinase n=1 Tax=Sodalis sp. dw_96 TaxID=2719794 RepID=UPI001BD1D031|nr:heavy metal sensor histidine kinase [Sodalis sp. dw_96]